MSFANSIHFLKFFLCQATEGQSGFRIRRGKPEGMAAKQLSFANVVSGRTEERLETAQSVAVAAEEVQPLHESMKSHPERHERRHERGDRNEKFSHQNGREKKSRGGRGGHKEREDRPPRHEKHSRPKVDVVVEEKATEEKVVQGDVQLEPAPVPAVNAWFKS